MQEEHKYLCKRCGYETNHKHCLISHLQKIKTCPARYNDIPTCDLVQELKRINEGAYVCQYCSRCFNDRSNMRRHEMICKHAPEPLTMQLEQLQLKMEQFERKLTSKEQSDIADNSKLLLELQYYKNRKNEKFYQLLVENYLGGTHKTLPCGITDVTTDDCHAEIKEWKCWKEAIGQLTCYNKVDPKPKLHMYMFGRYTDACRQPAISIAKECGFHVFEFKENTDGHILIQDCFANTCIHTYAPPQ